jgi:hypothetical protein
LSISFFLHPINQLSFFNMLRRIQYVCLLVAAGVLLGLPVSAQQNPQRLVLKDSSYQTVTKWEIRGDRVRYYSAERYAWEEIPNDLIDWPATEKYNRERDSQRSSAAGELVRQDEVDRQLDDVQRPLVSPGLRLPYGGGVFLLDDFHTQAQLAELAQNGGEVNRHTGKNILRAAINPLALSSKQTLELKGAHAQVQAHVPQPVIYVNVDPTDDITAKVISAGQGKDLELPAERYRIVRLERKKGLRVVGNLNIGLTGHVTEKASWIATTSSAVGDWVRVTPVEPLDPGEYAVVEMLDKKQVNLYVWDFGIDPGGAANPAIRTADNPGPMNENPPVNEKPRELEKRPK